MKNTFKNVNLEQQLIIDAVPNPIIITDGKDLEQCNEAFLNFLSIKSMSVFKKKHDCVCDLFINHENCFSLDMIDKNILWTDYLYSKIDSNRVVLMESASKENHFFNVSLKKLKDKSSKYVVVFTDITSLITERDTLTMYAYFDPLTKLYNRRKFDDILLNEIENKKRYGDSLSLIMFDIDYFKDVNDTYGHDVGDDILINLANTIGKYLRKNDILARWGGEEFMILLPRTDIETAFKKAKRIGKIVEEFDDGVLPKITISLGVTEIRSNDNKRKYIRRVDKALYKAKVKRNNTVMLS
jgi:diguanylate cyclase (GGDEF)-like protein